LSHPGGVSSSTRFTGIVMVNGLVSTVGSV
jgi:hypothetical protein